MKTLVLCLVCLVSCTGDNHVQDEVDAGLDASSSDCALLPDAGIDSPPMDAAADAAPTLENCAAMGCDGTQNVPLYCPGLNSHGDPDPTAPCFCAAPTGPDGWCFR